MLLVVLFGVFAVRLGELLHLQRKVMTRFVKNIDDPCNNYRPSFDHRLVTE